MHLGIIMTVNMEIGMVTPPVGLNLFVTAGIAKLPVTTVVRAATPVVARPAGDARARDLRAVAVACAAALARLSAFCGVPQRRRYKIDRLVLHGPKIGRS